MIYLQHQEKTADAAKKYYIEKKVDVEEGFDHTSETIVDS